MVAAVETMMYAKEGGVPWHKLGTAVDGAPTSLEALTLAGIDWIVEKRPVYFKDAEGDFIEVPNQFATVRVSDRTPLGIVADEYVVFQNADAFRLLDDVFKDMAIEARYETAGSLRDGKQIFVTARIPKDVVIGKLPSRFGTKDDVQFPYLLLSTGHDGKTALDVTPTSIRPVCWNTVNASLSAFREKFGVRLTHIQGLISKPGDIRRKLSIALREMDDFYKGAEAMAGIDARIEDIDKVTKVIIPEVFQLKDAISRGSNGLIWTTHPDARRVVDDAEFPRRLIQCTIDDDATKKALELRADKLSTFKAIYNQENPTLWGLFNAVTGYLDHGAPHRVRNGEQRFASLMEGRPAMFKNLAWTMLMEASRQPVTLSPDEADGDAGGPADPFAGMSPEAIKKAKHASAERARRAAKKVAVA